MDKKLKEDILHILTYFKRGLDDVQEGCDGEAQPMQKEINSALSRLKKVDTKSDIPPKKEKLLKHINDARIYRKSNY